MLATHLLSINELSPGDLCNYIETRHYAQLEGLLHSLDEHSKALEDGEAPHEPFMSINLMLYTKLADECRQLMRFDKQIIFPLIRNDSGKRPCKGRKLPVDAIRHYHQKIMKLMERMKNHANSFMLQPSWSKDFKMFCDDAYAMEQCIQQAIYLKENLLLPQIADQFNQTCSGEHRQKEGAAPDAG